MKVQEAIAEARGRTIIIGEDHADRHGLRTTVDLIATAHRAGYRRLGVEHCAAGDDKYRGLDDELAMIRGLGCDGRLTEYDERSELAPIVANVPERCPRMNRHWQMRSALSLGWSVVPIDPCHWNWRLGTENGYLHSREPGMTAAIRKQGPMIAVCGYGHLAGLHRLLGREVVCVVCSQVRHNDEVKAYWRRRIRFASKLPLLIP